MKKIIALLICIVFIFCSFAVNAEDVWETIYVKTNDINVKVNGIDVNARNFVYEGTTYLALRDMGNVLGYTVGWDDTTKTASLTSGGVANFNFTKGEYSEGEIPVLVNSIKVVVDGNTINARNLVHEGTTYLALRDMGNATNYNVAWDEATRTAILTSKYVLANDKLTATVNDYKIPSIYLYATYHSVSGESEENINRALENSALQYAYFFDMAKKYNIEITKEEEEAFDVTTEMFIESVGGKDAVEALLATMGFTYEEYIEELKLELTLETIFNKLNNYYIANDQGIDDIRILAFKDYEANIESFTRPTVYVKHILIPIIEGNDSHLAKDKIEKIANDLKNGKSFDELLAKNNNDPGQTEEGYVVYEGSDFVKEFEKASLGLEKGEISDIVETKYGYHIIKAIDKSDYMPFEEAFLTFYVDKINARLLEIFDEWAKPVVKTFGWE